MIKSFKNIFVLLLLSSCSVFRSSTQVLVEVDPVGQKVLAGKIKPVWFDTAKRFRLQNKVGQPEPHLFFDVSPSLEDSDKSLNFIITTIRGSTYGQELDPVSGKHYTARAYCPQEDVWGKGKGSHLPPYSEGVIPRYLDQLNLPQRVILFDDNEAYAKTYQENFFRGRVVGGFIEQSCPEGTCVAANSWLSRLVLVAVAIDSKKYKDITNLSELVKKVDWKEVQGFVENGNGKNYFMERFTPAFRMGALVDADQAYEHFKKNSYYFDIEKMKNLKFSCYKLYDHAWKTLSFESILEKPAKDKEAIKQKAILMERIRKENVRDVFFSERFGSFMKKFSKQFETCSEYVYAGNINDDPKRFWFMSYLQLFAHLQRLGHYYDCSRNSWESNPLLDNKQRRYSIADQFRGCSSRSIDLAFDYGVNYLHSLKANNRDSYRFIDYDRHTKGTHNKLYSWVKVPGKVLSCNNKQLKSFTLDLETFPKDISWEKKEVNVKETSTLGDIIY